MNRNAVVITIVVIVVIILGAILFLNQGSHAPGTSPTPSVNLITPTPSTAASNLPSATPSQAAAISGATVSYDGSSFTVSPSTMKAGGTLTVINHSSATLDFDSDPHPVHTDEPELNLGAIAPGTSKSARITKTGTWGFHNHLNPSQHGQITVQ